MASRLEVPGMLRSSSTTRGACARVRMSAASASPASATTLKSSSASSRRLRPPRTSAWSSASRIVIASKAPPAGSATVSHSISGTAGASGATSVRRQEKVGVVLLVTTATCSPAWASGAPMGFSVASVGTLQMRSPVTGLRSLEERKSL